MKKLKVGTRVETSEGLGVVEGYDLEHSDVWRHIVKLDSGKLWNGNNPAFFHNQIKPVLKKPFSYVIYPHEIIIIENKRNVIIKTFEYSREEHFDNLSKAKHYTNYLNIHGLQPSEPEN